MPPQGAQGDRKWLISIKLAQKGNFIAWIDQKQPKHDFANSPTFPQNYQNLYFTSLFWAFRMRISSIFFGTYLKRPLPIDRILILKIFIDPTSSKSPPTWGKYKN